VADVDGVTSAEALWTLEFEAPRGWANGGVLVLETGRILGGDSHYYYVGKFSLVREKLDGVLKASHYHGDDVTAFGVRTKGFEARVVAQLQPTGLISGILISPTPGIGTLAFRMTRRHPLP